MNRKDFLKAALAFAGAGAALSFLASCGGSDHSSSNVGAGNCSTNGAHDSAISGNHGHTLFVPAADVTAANQKSYNIQGVADHPHTITISQAQFGILAQGQTFTVVSTNDAGHTHNVTVACA